MTEGLKLLVTSKELKRHCQERAVHHKTRAEQKEGELPKLREAVDRIKQSAVQMMAAAQYPAGNSGATGGMPSGYRLDSSDPVGDLEKSIGNHKDRSRMFVFYAEHWFDGDYTLTHHDLQYLEFLK